MAPGIISPQNLIREVRPESGIKRSGLYGRIIFEAVTIISAGVLGFFYRGYIAGDYTLFYLLGSATVFAIFSALQPLLIKRLKRRILTIIIQTFAILFFFYDYKIEIIAAAGISIIVITLIGEILSRRYIENSLELRFFKIVRPLLAKLTTAIIISFVILYIPTWNEEGVFISENSFGGFFGWSSEVVTIFYPNINLNSSFGGLTEGVAKTQLGNDENFRNFSPSAQENLLSKATLEVSEKLSGWLGVEISPESSVGNVLYDFTTKTLSDWRSRFGDLFLAIWGIAIFFVFRGFGIIFYWISATISYIIYQIILSFNLVHIIGETRTKETIEW